MIRCKLHIEGYDWMIMVLFAVTPGDTMDAIIQLRAAGCEGAYITDAWRLLSEEQINSGLTYSNRAERRSVIITTETTGPEEFTNTLAHELNHLCSHIEKTYGIDPWSEEASYLMGDVAGKLFPAIAELICPQCREPTKT